MSRDQRPTAPPRPRLLSLPQHNRFFHKYIIEMTPTLHLHAFSVECLAELDHGFAPLLNAPPEHIITHFERLSIAISEYTFAVKHAAGHASAHNHAAFDPTYIAVDINAKFFWACANMIPYISFAKLAICLNRHYPPDVLVDGLRRLSTAA